MKMDDIYLRHPQSLTVAGSILKCAQLKRSTALCKRDSTAIKDACDFLSLYRGEFIDRLVSAAHASERVHGNTLAEFPDEDDLQQLRDDILETGTSQHAGYSYMAIVGRYAMMWVLVFNGHHGAEVAQLKVSDFAKACCDFSAAEPRWKAVTEQIGSFFTLLLSLLGVDLYVFRLMVHFSVCLSVFILWTWYLVKITIKKINT